MKTLSQVIDEVKDGGRPEYDELRYAVVALSALHHFSFNKLLDLDWGSGDEKLCFDEGEQGCDDRVCADASARRYFACKRVIPLQ